jgi:MFS family permease
MLGPVIGKLVDAYGSRKVAIPFAVLTVLSVCMLSLCKTYTQVMLAQGLAFGIGSSGLWMPSIVMTTQWFSSKRGLAVGIVSSGSSLGKLSFIDWHRRENDSS